MRKLDFKPALTLALITVIITTLLVIMDRSMQTDVNELSGNLKDKCVELMGDGDFDVISDFAGAGYDNMPKGVKKLIVNTDNGSTAFQVITKGYSKDGVNLLIVMNSDASAKSIAVVELTETTGIGTKVNDKNFLDEFIGRKDVKIVKTPAQNDNEIMGITGATKSSKGVADAVNIASEAYGIIFGEAD